MLPQGVHRRRSRERREDRQVLRAHAAGDAEGLGQLFRRGVAAAAAARHAELRDDAGRDRGTQGDDRRVQG